jgi:hypothetical protein
MSAGSMRRFNWPDRCWRVPCKRTRTSGGADESSVAVTVTLQSLGHVNGRDRDPLASTSAEIEQVEHLAVALDAPVGAEQPRLAELIVGESRSGEARRDATLVFDGHDLVIDHVVVAGIDAAAVRAIPQGRQDTFDSAVRRDGLQRPALPGWVAETGQRSSAPSTGANLRPALQLVLIQRLTVTAGRHD